MICMLIEVHIQPSRIDEFLKVIERNAVCSEKDEPGCLRFDVLRDNEDPMKFYFYEVYTDEAAKLAHRKTPHYAEWARFAENGLDREIKRHGTTNLHPTDAAWR
jgi:autoinducer 2-degrading protein